MATPATATGPTARSETVRDLVNRRFAALDSERSSFIPHWHDLARFLLPRRGRFFDQKTQDKGRKKHQAIVNNAGLFASRVLASGMMSGLTSPARPWFRLTVADPLIADRHDVRHWLDDVARRMRDVLSRSNFYTAMAPFYRELGVFGTSPVAMLEDERDVVRFYPFTVGTYYLGQDERLVTNTFGREFTLTAEQMIGRFGMDRVSATVRQAYQSNRLDQTFPVRQLIQPNTEYLPLWQGMRGMPFRSMIVEAAAANPSQPNAVLEDKGFHEFPILAGRWEAMDDTAYGATSPGMDSLGDNRQLQFTEVKKDTILDKINDPPLSAPPGLQGKTVGLFPGAITFRPQVQGTNAAVSVIHTPDPRAYQFSSDQVEKIVSRIEAAFYVDLFLMLDRINGVQPRNMMELAERREEKLLMLGPVLEQLNSDVFDQMIDRLFAVMWRRGMIPLPPPVLQGAPLKVEYTSVMAQAQRAIATGNIERFGAFAGQLSAVFGPAVLDRVNADEMLDDYADAMGLPARHLRAEAEVQAIREGRAKQEQAAQMAAMAPAMKQGMDAMAKAAETVPKDGSIAQAMAGALAGDA